MRASEQEKNLNFLYISSKNFIIITSDIRLKQNKNTENEQPLL